MLSYKVKNETVEELAVQGTLTDILGESSFLIRGIYNAMAMSDKNAAKAFQAHFALLAADPESPMWEEDKPNCTSMVRRAKPEEGKRDAE